MRELLNEFILPAVIYVEGKPFRPTDLTCRAVVVWLKHNLGFGNRNHPKLGLAFRKLDELLGVRNGKTGTNWSRTKGH